ncbi:MAG: MOSC domain-containing protein [Thermodesulfovibrionales bacterium]|nr:MOSC domain-containing protein [Thermodesulfovibrionales bacterium]
MQAKIVSINISDKKGEKKKPVETAQVIENYGIEGDAHASSKWHRQVSVLSIESINKMKKLDISVNPGDFAENITTEGIDLLSLPVGTRIKFGSGVNAVIGEISQIGKVCHDRCAIYNQVGDCVMPKEGIFLRILKGGQIKIGDPIDVSFRISIDEMTI